MSSADYLPKFVVKGAIAPKSLSSALLGQEEIAIVDESGTRIRVLNRELHDLLLKNMGEDIEALGIEVIDEKKETCILIFKFAFISHKNAA